MQRAWLFLLAFPALACTPETPQGRSPTPPLPVASLAFTDVTTEAGLGDFQHENGARGDKWFPETMMGGICVLDYDGDTWPDLLLTGGYEWPSSGNAPVAPLRLYRNNQDGTFREQTAEAGLDLPPTLIMAAIPADYDNDGDPDVYLTTLHQNLLLENRNGIFVDATAATNAGGPDVWSTTAMFFDADRDGWLDVLVGNYIDWSPETNVTCSSDGQHTGYCTPEIYAGVPGFFLRNTGQGTFEASTEASGFENFSGKTLGLTTLDYNADGWLDVAVANDTDPDQLFENQGNGRFVERGVSSGFALDEDGRARAGMGIDVGDVTGTGVPTLFVGNFSEEMLGVYTFMGHGLFLERAAASRIGRPSLPTLTFGLFLFDPDLDGDLDLFTANGHLQEEIAITQAHIGFRQPPHLFVNDGTGQFSDEATHIGPPFTQSFVGRGAAYLDYDQDGDPDLAMIENDGPVHLWRNDTIGRSVRIRLVGRTSARDAIGTEVVGFIQDHPQRRTLRGGHSYLSQSERQLFFGLGEATQLDSLHVRWPSGAFQRYDTIRADTLLTLYE